MGLDMTGNPRQNSGIGEQNSSSPHGDASLEASHVQHLGLVAACAFAACFAVVVVLAPSSLLQYRFADTGAYYLAGRAFLTGTDPYTASDLFPYVYWPVATLLFAPFTVLPPFMAGRLVAMLVTFSASYGYVCLWYRLRREGLAPTRSWFVLIAVGTPTLVVLYLGQLSGLVFGLYAVGLLNLDRRPALAGLCFALMVIKPHLGLLALPALLAAAPRAWFTFLLGTLCWPIASLAVFGPGRLLEYGNVLLGMRDHAQGFAAASFSALLPLPEPVHRIAQLGILVLFLAGLAIIALRRLRHGARLSHRAVDAATAFALASLPFAIAYDLPFAAPALIRLGHVPSVPARMLIVGWWLTPWISTAFLALHHSTLGALSAILPPALAVALLASPARRPDRL